MRTATSPIRRCERLSSNSWWPCARGPCGSTSVARRHDIGLAERTLRCPVASLLARVGIWREPTKAGKVEAWPRWDGCRDHPHALTVRAAQDVSRSAAINHELSHDVRGSATGAAATCVGHLAPED